LATLVAFGWGERTGIEISGADLSRAEHTHASLRKSGKKQS
jgi:hypothetical protein